jgi:cell division protein FtsN
VARAPLPHLVALLCGVLAALAAGCGDRSNLIPQTRADSLTKQLADIKASVDQGECDGLSDRVKAFHDDATSLSSSVDARLRKRLNQGVASLQDHASTDCQAAADAQTATQTQPQTTDTQTQTTDTTTTQTQTQTQTETQTGTTTQPSSSAPPSTSAPGTTTQPPADTTGTPPAANGGVTPDDGTTP